MNPKILTLSTLQKKFVKPCLTALESSLGFSDSAHREGGRRVEDSVGGFYKLYLEMASINSTYILLARAQLEPYVAAREAEKCSLSNGPEGNT